MSTQIPFIQRIRQHIIRNITATRYTKNKQTPGGASCALRAMGGEHQSKPQGGTDGLYDDSEDSGREDIG